MHSSVKLKSERRQPGWGVVPGLLAGLVLTACSSLAPTPVESSSGPAATTRSAADAQRISRLERQLTEQQRLASERQRQCLEDRLQLERMLKESQYRSDELQKKLDAILAIDRDLRRGNKER
jgi:hypothetical protein